LREVAATLEELGRSGKLDGVQTWLDRLKFEGGRVINHSQQGAPSAPGQSAGTAREGGPDAALSGDKQCAS